MTKTKKELRAEAVERLRVYKCDEEDDYIAGALGVYDAILPYEEHGTLESDVAKIIELLTDDEGEVCDHVWTVDYNTMYASCPPKYKWTCIKCGETRVSASCPGDFSFDDKGSLVLKHTVSSDSDTQRKLQAWLDLIVERDRYKNMLARAVQGIAELQAKLDYLKAHGITISEPFCGGYEVYNEWKHKADELAAERDYWREQLRKCLDATRVGEDAKESLMAYPLPTGRVQPYLMVIDEIDSERDFTADVKRLEYERDAWRAETDKLWSALCRIESRLDELDEEIDGPDAAMPEGVNWPRWSDGSLVEFGQKLTGIRVKEVSFNESGFHILGGNGWPFTLARDLYGTTYEKDEGLA